MLRSPNSLGGALQEATAASAVFQFFVRDVMGMIGGVVFASTQGSSFDSNAKQWRLFADCLNNVGVQISLHHGAAPSVDHFQMMEGQSV